PVNVTAVPVLDSEGYSENLSIHVWLKADGMHVQSLCMQTASCKCVFTYFNCNVNTRALCVINVFTLQWELVRVKLQAGTVVSVRYSTASTSCNISYKVNDPVPAFELEANQLSKSFNVTLGAGDNPVYARYCYRYSYLRKSIQDSPPKHSQSAVLDFPFLLPCTCVEVYYTYGDSRRNIKCPFLNQNFTVRYVQPVSSTSLPPSAGGCRITCARPHSGRHKYNTSLLDKHPLMCVQFSLQGSHHVYCPFPADLSSWEVYLGPGGQGVFLYITSSIPAMFSAQLCLQKDGTCVPLGEIHSVTLGLFLLVSPLTLPLPFVQVWRSSPPLIGRRILCPDYTHRRHGLYAVAILMFIFTTAIVITFLHRLTKSGTTGWLCIHKPALLVCSSEQSAHISAVCALASILQGELSATVHMALWALTSQTKDGARAGVADLGPLPWLYGQWEAVVKEQGKVLIVWSSEAKTTYEKWKEQRKKGNKTVMSHNNYSKFEKAHEKLQENTVEYSKTKRKRQKDPGQSCNDKDSQEEPCTVIAPVFMAALACLEGAIKKHKGQGVALVYFQGFCHNRDIPKAFRGVPRYCLPQDFRGLLQELGATQGPIKTGNFGSHCVPRLLSKVMSVWLARRLAQKLQTLIPQTQGKKKLRVTSSKEQALCKTQDKLKLPPTEDTAGAGTSQEREPLQGSPTREEI
uniref:SEFIR domain-containing protein n=1 Tax=Takifugu rubripes TaxID=31033 RepID=A0A674NQ57_TAKRU